MSLRRSMFALGLLLPGTMATLWGTDAQACDWAPGVQSVHPSSASTLASNDAIVVAMLDASLEPENVQVLIDGAAVETESPLLFDGQSVFLPIDHHVLTLPEGALAEGSSVVVNRLDEDDGSASELATYTVGAADESPLLGDEIGAAIEVSFMPADEGDSCGVPDNYSAHLVLDAPVGFEDGARSRFIELVFYPADQGPEAAIGRTVRSADDGSVEFYASAPGDADPSTLCARASVTDVSGEAQLLVEDCTLCDSFPELCEDGGGETDGEAESDSDSAGGAEGGSGGGCNVGGAPGGFALVLLGMLGAGVRRRRRSTWTPS